MNTNDSRGGFGTIELVIALVVVALIGFGGWYVWQSKQEQVDKTQSNASQESVPDTNEEVTVDQYLQVKEWGVKFKLDEAVKDATYRLTQDGNQWFYVTTPRLNDLSAETQGCGAAKESISINRAKVGDEHHGSPWTEEDLQKIGTKHGEYYYYAEAGQPCFGDGSADITEITTIRADLSNVVKTVTTE